jgi:hypothetical protein
MMPGEDGNSEVAMIEFNTRDDAAAAQTRDQKTFDGNTIQVHFGSETTLFVTNFPPTADENYIRDLFSTVSLQPLAHITTDLTFIVWRNNRHPVSFAKV